MSLSVDIKSHKKMRMLDKHVLNASVFQLSLPLQVAKAASVTAYGLHNDCLLIMH